MKKKILLLGCGYKQKPSLSFNDQFTPYNNTDDDIIRLDMNESVDPDIIHNLEQRPFPFNDNEFDEIHAYEVIEHIGRQGDWKGFFDEFTEYHRILKPNGLLIGTSPAPHSKWVWADPGHTRAISPELLVWLSQKHYESQPPNSPCTDYRFYYKANFEVTVSYSNDILLFALRKK